MSDMLKAAIADAKKLQEAAIKSVETVILEKYSNDIKEAIDDLLEARPEDNEEDLFGPNAEGTPTEDPQDSLMGDFDGELDIDSEEPVEASPEEDPGASFNEPVEDDSFPEMPEAAMDGEAVGGVEQSGGTIEIDLGQLEAMADQSSDSELSPDVTPHEGIVGDVEPEVNADDALEDPLSEEFEFELDEDLVKELAEAVSVDHQPVPTGKPAARMTSSEEAEATALGLAALKDDAVAEEIEELKKSIDSLKEAQNGLESDNKKLRVQLKKTGSKLLEVNASNTKLHYSNRILKDNSLNENQKAKLVEALSKVGSVEEAKAVFEAAKELVKQSVSANREPRGLSETISRRKSLFLKRNEEQQDTLDEGFERMRLLANIPKN